MTKCNIEYHPFDPLLSGFRLAMNFDDGFPNLYINNAQEMRGQHVAFLAAFSSPGVIFEQLSVIYALPRLFVASFTLVLPFFPTGSFERMEEEGDVATAFTMARILSNIPISRGGPTSLVIYDIHALQERFYFGDHVLPLFETGIPLLKQRLHQLPDSDKIVVAFPDDGAWKRFHKLLDHFPMVVCTKVREGDKRIVRLKEGILLKVLVAHGGGESECICHPWLGECICLLLDHRFMPPYCQAIANKPPFEVLSLAGSLRMLCKYEQGTYKGFVRVDVHAYL
ncbi:hypothetical protein GH714_014714 [Hevea brasiliensis]|uniref:Ribose-phosphate pyrophosphokinase N-terminal domain-containing protein n=1 Tax=Hevea brasiliensis TaxID=3981 RepID=A0A6A6KRN9_HEVBR|nr:hypothetical protein GH714_014714 [Hevea brasiliensis]